jgi:hypothetical protein
LTSRTDRSGGGRKRRHRWRRATCFSGTVTA